MSQLKVWARVLVFSAVIGVSSLAAEESELGLGLRPLTPEEQAWADANETKLDAMPANQTALDYINADRVANGKTPLTLAQLEAQWDAYDSGLLKAPAPALPMAVDNSATQYFPPIRSQGSIGSCASWSSTYYQFTYYNAKAHGWNAAGGDNAYIFSPKFTYNMINGGVDAGSNHSSNYSILTANGCARWILWIYDSSYLAWCRTASTWKDAMQYRLDRWGSVQGDYKTPEGLNNLKRALTAGHVMYFSTYFNSFEYRTVGNDPAITEDDTLAGQHYVRQCTGYNGPHAMTLVGYNDYIWCDINGNGVVDPGEKGAFKVANSHGTGYQDSGYVWFAYDSLQNDSLVSGWTENSGKHQIFSAAYWMDVKKDYKPAMIAEFTLRTYQRRYVNMRVGVGEPTDIEPKFFAQTGALYWTGGDYCFDGSYNLISGSFAFDITPAMVNANDPAKYSRYFLDARIAGGFDLDVLDVKFIDNINTVTVTHTDPPDTIPVSTNKYYYTDYAFTTTNTPPTITAIADQTIGVDESTGALSFTVGDAQTAAANLGLQATSSDNAIANTGNFVWGGSGASRTIEVIPNEGKTGSVTITVIVTDGQASASTSFTIHVSDGSNTPPVISAISDQTATAGIAKSVPFTVTDTETDPDDLTLAVIYPTASFLSARIDGTGTNRTLVFAAKSNESGVFAFIITAQDEVLKTQRAFNVTVNPLPSNTPPTLGPIADQTGNQGHTISVPFTVGDAETDPGTLLLTYSVDTWMYVQDIRFEGDTADRTMIIIPRSNYAGSCNATITVTDGEFDTSRTFVVTYLPTGNTAPIILPIPAQVMAKNATLIVPFELFDAEMDEEYLNVSAYPSDYAIVDWNGIKITGEGANRQLEITPLTDQTGTLDIQLQAWDFGTWGPELSFTLTIYDTTPPTISAIADQTIAMNGSTGAIAFTIGDAETAAASLNLSATTSDETLIPAANVTFGGSAANRTVTVTPATGRSGMARVNVKVDDGELSANETFLVTVTSANTPPVISAIADQSTNENVVLGPVAFTVSDAVTPAASLVLSASTSNPAIVPVSNIVFGGSGTNRTFTITPETGTYGIADIVFYVDDGQTRTAEAFRLTVINIDDAPVLSTIPNQTAYSGASFGPASFTLTDSDSELWSYQLKAYSSDESIILSRDILFTGWDENRTIEGTTLPGASGVCTILVQIEDWTGTIYGSTSFQLTVNANNSPLYNVSGYSRLSGTPHTYSAYYTQGDSILAGEVGINASDVDATDPLTLTIVQSGSYSGSTKPAFTTPMTGSGTLSLPLTCGALNGSGILTYTIQLDDGKVTPITAIINIYVNPSGNNTPTFSAGTFSKVTGGPTDFVAVYQYFDVITTAQLGIRGVDLDGADSLTLTVAKDNTLSVYNGTVQLTFTSPATAVSPVSISMKSNFPMNGTGKLVYNLTLTDAKIATPVKGTLTVIINKPPVYNEGIYTDTTLTGTAFSASFCQGETITAGRLGVEATDPNAWDTVTLTAVHSGGTYTGTVLPTFTTPATGSPTASLQMTTAAPLDGSGTILYNLTAADGVAPASVAGTLTITVSPNAAPLFSGTGFSSVSGGPTAFTAVLQQGASVSAGVLGIRATDGDATDNMTLTLVRNGGTYAGTVVPSGTSPATGVSPISIPLTSGALDGYGTIIYDLTLTDGVISTPRTGTLTVTVNAAPTYSATGYSAVSGGPTAFTAAFNQGATIAAGQLGIRGNDLNGNSITITAARSGGTYAGAIEPAFTSPTTGASGTGLQMTTSSALDGHGTIIYSLTLTDGIISTPIAGTLTVTVNGLPVFNAAGHTFVSGGPTAFTATIDTGDSILSGEIGMAAVDPDGGSLTLSIAKTGGTYSGTIEPTFPASASGASPVSINMLSAALDGYGTLIYSLTANDGTAPAVNGTLTIRVNALPTLNANGTLVSGGPTAYHATVVNGSTMTAGQIGIRGTDSDASDTLTLTAALGGGTYSGTVFPAFTSPATGATPAIGWTSGSLNGTGTIIYNLTLTDSVASTTTTGTLTITVTPPNITPTFDAVGFSSVSGGPTAFTTTVANLSVISASQIGIRGTDANAADTLTLTAVKTGGTYAGSNLPAFTTPSTGTTPVSIQMLLPGGFNGIGTLVYSLTLTDGVIGSPINATLTITVTNVAPVVTGIVANPNPVLNQDTCSLTGTANDPDSAPSALTYHWSATGPGTAAFSPNGTTASLSTATFSASGAYTIRLIVNDGLSNSAPFDLPLNVTLPPPSVTVTAPNGGETLNGLSALAVAWTSSGAVGNVHIEFYNGTIWSDIIASTPNDGSHMWTLPNTNLTACLVRVSDAATGLVSDVSNATFSVVFVNDTDGDGMDDAWEITHFGDLTHNGSGDTDSDGLTDLEEYQHGTDPLDSDSDNDTITDGDEIDIHGTDPLDADTDGDGMPDEFEIATPGLNPLVNDAAGDFDGDTYSNLAEYNAGTDPNDIFDHPTVSTKSVQETGCALNSRSANSIGWLATMGILLTALKWRKE